jgi:hypothetical protein
MSLTMYDASVTVFVRQLGQLSHLVGKAIEYTKSSGVEAGSLIEARLIEDMRPFAFQIQSASDASKLAVVRLTGVEAPSFPDTESTFDQLLERIVKTQHYLQGVPKEAFVGSEERTVTMKTGAGSVDFKGQGYLLHFAIPNFFFHVTTAYAILRSKGVVIGKRDYLGPFDSV